MVHRLRLLLITTRGVELPAKSADLLFGPLVYWMTASPAERMEVPGALHAADDAAACAGTKDKSDPRFVVALRMCTLWALHGVYGTGIFPRQALYSYYTGIAMDLHQRALRLKRAPTVCAVYSVGVGGDGRGFSPETTLVSDIVCSEEPALPTHAVEDLWRVHLSCSRSALPASSLVPIDPDDIPRESALGCPPALGSGDGDGEEGAHLRGLMQLLPKAMLDPAAKRYIMKPLRTGLGGAIKTNPLIARLVRAFVLGAYPHVSETIAPPRVRCWAYNADAADLLALVERFSKEELFDIVAEFTVSATTEHEALSAILAGDAVYRRYSRAAVEACNTVLRPKAHAFVLGVAPPEPPPKPRAKRASVWDVARPLFPPLGRVFWELVRVLKIAADIDVAALGTAAEGIGGGARGLYRVLRCQPQNLRLHRGILRRIGMTEDDMAVLRDTLVDIGPDRLARTLGDMASRLSPAGAAKLVVYVHYVAHRARIACRPIHTRRLVEHRKDRPPPFMLVCNNCATIRSEAVTPSSKTKKKSKKKPLSAMIDTFRGAIVCGACSSTDLGVIDMRRYVVTGSTPNTPVPATYGLCSGCGKTTPCDKAVGTSEFCANCYIAVAQNLLLRHCICGAVVDTDGGPFRKVVALNEYGERAIYALCADHTEAAGYFRPGDAVPVAAYRALIEGGL